MMNLIRTRLYQGALCLTLALLVFVNACPVLAQDAGGGLIHPKGGSGTSEKSGTPSGPQRNSFGVDHGETRFGISLVTGEMRQNPPAYYGAAKSKPADAPLDPVPSGTPTLTPQDLAEKYRITFIDKAGYLTGPYGEKAVQLIDAGLSQYSTEFVQTLVDRWAGIGRYFTINLHYPSQTDQFKGATEVNETTLTINLAVPLGENPGGISVNTVCHEFGHAVFLYIEKCMGAENLYRQWTAFNGRYNYGSRDPGRAHAFISDYGSQYYYEDPATIFEAFASAPDLVALKLSESKFQLLLKKAQFLDSLVCTYIGTPGTVFSDVWDRMPERG